MFEVTADDIVLLSDSDLRELVGKLCEAEGNRCGLSTRYVTWGGHQDASDGGLDVRVEFPIGTVTNGFVPRPVTGFQVKKSDMPRSKIVAEMKPDGSVRSVIRELAEKDGAYIIVAAAGSASDSALQNRRNAMAQAVAELQGREALALDFYDCNRVATWVREHSGLTLWVKQKIGRSLRGWQPYGAWAYPAEGVEGEYLVDEAVRVRTGKKERDGGISVVDGITRIREILQTLVGVVRLVGLSGLGKTRLVQALFDERVGQQSLPASLALYTNMADNPDPQPIALASDLIALRRRAILVVDNCPPDLHRRLAELCASSQGLLSVITIEYDIREDQPEGTEVFDLLPYSNALIEKLLKRRFPALSAVDASTITNFSHGNARIAINIASTIGINESVAGLTDEELFLRLFRQRHDHDQSLLSAAQALSLVYSFNGEDISSTSDAELERLGRLVGKSALEMFQAAAELKRRDLVQQRGVWRGVLPQAIANRLAAGALQDIPFALVERELVNDAPERLLRSFSRRLGYLHTSKEAVVIVERWLNDGGLLGKVLELNELGRTLFRNIAPVSPEATLAALDRSLRSVGSETAIEQPDFYLHLLRLLAYDAALFERCAELMSQVVEHPSQDQGKKDTDEVFHSLFTIYLSGTYAKIEQRVAVIESFLASGMPQRRLLGRAALESVVKTHYFSSMNEFEFGARSRDYGYQPRTSDDVKHWFSTALAMIERLVLSPNAGVTVLAALARNFRGLWTQAGMHDELEYLCRSISQARFWPEGWIAVRETQHHDSSALSTDSLAKLASLEAILRPKNVLQRVRSIVFSDHFIGIDPESEDSEQQDIAIATRRVEDTSRNLGMIVANEEIFEQLLPELVTKEGHLWSFGIGLAEGANNPHAVWTRLITQLKSMPESDRRITVLCGFLCALSVRNWELTASILDDAVAHDELLQYYPGLQSSVTITPRDVERLLCSLKIGKAPIRSYRSLSGGRATEPISGSDMRRLLGEIVGKPQGFDVALEILFMKLHLDKDKKSEIDPELLLAGRELMLKMDFGRADIREDYHLGEVVKACLVGEEGSGTAAHLCSRLRESFSKRTAFASTYDGMLQGLLVVQPTASLDALFPTDATQEAILMTENNLWHRNNPFDSLPEADLLAWCDQKPASRYPLMASAITIYDNGTKPGPPRWSERALRLLEKSPNRVEVLKQYVRKFTPSSWSGSRAAAIENNVQLFDELNEFSDGAVSEFVTSEKIRFARLIEAQKRMETEEDRTRDERFE